MSNDIENINYKTLLGDIKTAIQQARLRAAFAVNTEMIILYWQTGKMIAQRQQQEGWAAKVIPRLAVDLKYEFTDLKGFSERNLSYMLRFALEYPEQPILQQAVAKLPDTSVLQQSVANLPQAVAKLPWGHNILLMEKVKDKNTRLWYAQQTIEKGWSRDWLLNAIKMDSFSQAQIKSHNFEQTLPSVHSNYANEVFKDNYNLGFLGISEQVKETELEKRLVEKIKSFILELGKGFSFIGNQHRLEYNGKEYFVDMLFFHRGLQSLVAIELKIGSFKAEYVGKMNLYLSLLDKLEKGENENQSIGIILCADKDHLDVEIALQDINKPIGVAEYQLLLPKDKLQNLLIEEIKKSEE
ncbi:PDDEXK nuclease domain-containing protein [Pedobacter sp. UBA4863]|uniref:PDDEXK nuclease domain-containing protein n=1 Tax=Pedobacter sp. UBA4863 TaxID=1947060 RepID=UPI0025E73E4E|nr:PDDEXK nuclease domain-containing protein [Pedobacter sp. UBA4863]